MQVSDAAASKFSNGHWVNGHRVNIHCMRGSTSGTIAVMLETLRWSETRHVPL